MPQNLNALIRYKTIDRCLRNKYTRCDIRRLQEECSEALGEARGKTDSVSERTIRDDLRIMRSDILGFNAPIVVHDGIYAYSDPDYSIFNVSLGSKALMLSVMDILLANRQLISNPMLDTVLEELSLITGKKLPDMVPDKAPIEHRTFLREEQTDYSMELPDKSESDECQRDTIQKSIRKPASSLDDSIPDLRFLIISEPMKTAAGPSWGDVLLLF